MPERRDCNAVIVPDSEMQALCDQLNGDVNRKLNQKIGELAVVLDCTFAGVRGSEVISCYDLMHEITLIDLTGLTIIQSGEFGQPDQ